MDEQIPESWFCYNEPDIKNSEKSMSGINFTLSIVASFIAGIVIVYLFKR